MTKTEFEQFIINKKNKFYRFAFSILQNQEDAKDAVQEVVFKLWKKRAELDAKNNIESFCMNSIKNYAFDILRKKKVEISAIANLNVKNTEIQNIENVDLLEKLKVELKNLSVQQRLLIELKDFQGYKYEEISEMLGMKINAIRVEVSRGRKKLQLIFKEELKNA